MAWDVDKAVKYLDDHQLGASHGRCAQYTRQAVEAGGVVLARHESAKDYGPSLIAVGFRESFAAELGSYQKGDVAIIQPIPGHPHGHMCMYDGKYWVSDFKQYHGFYPGASYRKIRPPFKIYRYGSILWDAVQSSQGAVAYA